MNSTLRELVSQRAKNCCEYCAAQAAYSQDPFSVEHIWPLSKGGTSVLDNLAWACFGCNGIKYNATHAIDPATGRPVPLFNPRTELWSDHFKWSEDFTLVIGLTPIGRATVVKLQLNRDGLVSLRGVLVVVGKHPPH